MATKSKNIRKRISKETRQKVFEKYDGHCAYCGCELTMEDMQVDHIHSMCKQVYLKDDVDSLDKYNPSCDQCNFYKGIYSIEVLRESLSTLMKRLNKIFLFRLALKYGMIDIAKWDGKFYFEKQNQVSSNP